MILWDAHTHPQFAAYDKDQAEVMARAKNEAVKMIAVGTALSTSRDAIALAEAHPYFVWATAGVHPTHFTDEYHDIQETRTNGKEQKTESKILFDVKELKTLARHERVVAIGECGLDYYRISKDDTVSQEKQKNGFLAHIEIAHAAGKPLMIHCRAAFGDLISILDSSSSTLHSFPGVVHFMSGMKDDARRLLDMGFSFTFGGVITFTHDYDELIQYIPVDRILSETDAPYVAPVPYRGKRNEPAYVKEVIGRLAELKNVSYGEMAENIQLSVRRVFNVS